MKHSMTKCRIQYFPRISNHQAYCHKIRSEAVDGVIKALCGVTFGDRLCILRTKKSWSYKKKDYVNVMVHCDFVHIFCFFHSRNAAKLHFSIELCKCFLHFSIIFRIFGLHVTHFFAKKDTTYLAGMNPRDKPHHFNTIV